MPKAAALALILTILAPSAFAECTVAGLQQLRARVAEVKDPARREEALRLLEKAEKDQRSSRDKLCTDAIQRLNTLIR
jgi:hypothetical protein